MATREMLMVEELRKEFREREKERESELAVLLNKRFGALEKRIKALEPKKKDAKE